MAIARNLYKAKFRKTGKLNDWKTELETILKDGWTGRGQTNDLLHKVAQYGRVFMGIVSIDTLINWVTDKVTELNGFTEFCGHKSDLLKRVSEWSKWVYARNFPLGNNNTGDHMATGIRAKQQADTRQRIIEASQSFNDRNDSTIPIRQMCKSIAKSVGCSQSTLYNNLALWHPEHISAVTTTQPVIEQSFTDDIEMQETATSQSQQTVTQNAYEGLRDASNPTKSSNFAPSRFAPLSPITDLVLCTKIKLIESQIRSRQNGRLDRKVLQEIEDLKQKLADLKH